MLDKLAKFLTDLLLSPKIVERKRLYGMLALTMPRLEALALALEVGRFIADDRMAWVKAELEELRRSKLGIW